MTPGSSTFNKYRILIARRYEFWKENDILDMRSITAEHMLLSAKYFYFPDDTLRNSLVCLISCLLSYKSTEGWRMLIKKLPLLSYLKLLTQEKTNVIVVLVKSICEMWEVVVYLSEIYCSLDSYHWRCSKFHVYIWNLEYKHIFNKGKSKFGNIYWHVCIT